ncbi:MULTISPECIES: TetR/AcrR family transcriptional regulator [unclassified Rathayibacter]|uniref:TetR/AcrR family transcriptional regulator n=1 Tax=unclassified Rathayibacter TaxID=2609250 RepID=UPI000CE7862C|nr:MULTISPECIES: TetR/AcrR family transcriptional regulator [unclassified Rathayibacter]PPF17129.1 TetR/AcrR family transcriptional regulator [Rathayibacter sp. AY1A4]PPG80075.1 TetR/AcrR family transcriptional regulator [Rathayibacter sp. AY1E5]PPH29696.1 TetR/AcrR family transcriptional regulator [Rathayibacter sp. AY1C3]PPH65218.1 TetR/AcrR family transcriptional regulator [Rathayibacter sp. AY1D7]PPH81736.1 TetR/AcrR family transcriptional regulator [Rathayibacter sp. AY1D9]
MDEQKVLRRDAQRNVEKLHAAALEVFGSRGLAAPLEDIARHAGVSIGTLYNRVGSREELIDAVIPAVAGEKLKGLTERALAERSSRGRLERFVSGMIDLQLEDPALNDAMLRRFPDAVALIEACDRSIELGRDLVEAAHRDGSLSPDFTHDDLMALLWMAGTTSRESAAPQGWRRVLDRSLAGAWTAPSS